MAQLAFLASCLVALVGLCAFVLMKARADGKAVQTATDLTQTSETNNAMLQADMAAPRTADAVDRSLRNGSF
jgi:hypothetical protein